MLHRSGDHHSIGSGELNQGWQNRTTKSVRKKKKKKTTKKKMKMMTMTMMLNDDD